jgi:hypothetical protein
MVSIYHTNDLRIVLNNAVVVEKALMCKITKLKAQKNNKVQLNSKARFFEKVLWKLVKKKISSTKKISNKKLRKIQKLELLQLELFTKTGLATDNDFSIQYLTELEAVIIKIKNQLKIDI